MKKIILSVAVVATAAIAGWNYQQSQQRVDLSDLALENVEALASGESDVSAKGCCPNGGHCVLTVNGVSKEYDNEHPCSAG